MFSVPESDASENYKRLSPEFVGFVDVTLVDVEGIELPKAKPAGSVNVRINVDSTQLQDALQEAKELVDSWERLPEQLQKSLLLSWDFEKGMERVKELNEELDDATRGFTGC